MPMGARLFGGFQLMSSDGRVVEVANRRARALLAMLLLEPNEPLERDFICKLLWTGRFEAQARASLRQCVLVLSRILDEFDTPIIEASRSAIGIRSGAVSTDLAKLETALQSGSSDDVCNRLRQVGAKPLLEQFQFGPGFDEWLIIRQNKTEQRLQTLVTAHLSKLEMSGQSSDCAAVLTAWSQRGGHTLGKTKGEIPIAVLPFSQFDTRGENDTLAEGVVDELITVLGRVPGLLVAGRTSSRQYRSTQLPLPAIAAELGVALLVEGSVEVRDEEVRINVRLIDGQTGFESWSYRFEGTLLSVFDSREKAAREVTAGICASLDIADHSIPSRTMTRNRDAYALYLQGRALTFRALGDGVLSKAIELLEQALVLDPEFAECWTMLAEAHTNVAVYTACPDRLGQSARAAECARMAIKLSPRQGHARAMLAIHQWTQNDIVGALDLVFEAYRLEPENPDVVMRLGSFLLYCGRSTDALPYIEAALLQDPVHGRNYAMLSMVNLSLGNLDAAIGAGQRTVDLGFPSLWLGVATSAAGDHELAVEQYRQSRLLMNTVIFPPIETAPMSPEAMDAYWLIAAKGVCSGQDADRTQYCQMLDMLYLSMADKYDSSIVFPAICMGHSDMMFKTLGEKITPQNFVTLGMLWSEIEPACRNRAHPEFINFATKIGMVAAWEKYGWPDLLPRPAGFAA